MLLQRREFLKMSTGVLAGLSVSTIAAATPAPRSTLAQIVHNAVASGATPGIQVCVVKDGQALSNMSAGHMNLETQSLVDAKTIFRIGSITKQFIGAMVLKLDSEGALALDNPAAKYLPVLARHASFTIRELLHHTAGVHDDQESPPVPGPVTQLQLAEAIAKQKQFFDFSPGTAWLYSNANYILLGAIVEAVTGATLADVAAKHISRPLQLVRTNFDIADAIVIGRASGYSLQDETRKTFKNAAWVDVVQTGGAGAMRSNSADLARWHQALLFGDFLSGKQREIYLAPARLRDGRLSSENRFSERDRPMGATQYGFGVHLDRSSTDHGLIVHHNGFIDGFSTYLATHMPSKTTVACLCNIDQHPALPFRDIRRHVFAAYLPAPAT
ncbi:MAG: serine hydrolase domain-containing protein [Pseudomonadota bacterium]